MILRRLLAYGEKCILVCDKTLTGGTVAVQDGRTAPSKRLCRAQLDTKIFSFWTSDFIAGKALLRLRLTASAPRQISYRIPLFSAIKYSIIAKKYPHGAISGECAAPFG